jgi:hypothetical protein
MRNKEGRGRKRFLRLLGGTEENNENFADLISASGFEPYTSRTRRSSSYNHWTVGNRSDKICIIALLHMALASLIW